MIQITNKNLCGRFYLRLFNLLLLYLLTTSTYSFGQIIEADSISTTDSIDYSDVEFSFFMMDFNYTNNKIKTKGKISDIIIPAYITNLSFLHKSGIQTGLMITNYSDADTLSYDLDFLLGYQKSFHKDLFDVDASYIYHYYKGEYNYEGLNYNHALNVSAGFTYKMLYLYGDGFFLLDNENYFTDAGATINVDFEDIFFKNDYLYIMPSVSFNFGTDHYLYDIYEPYINNVLIPYLRFKGYQTFNISTEEIIKRYLENQDVSTNTFSYQGVDFLVPVTFGIGSVSATFSWMYYIPSEKLEVFGMKDQTGYIISLSFIF